MSEYCLTLKRGSRVRVVNKSDSCCGTITQGWRGTVREYLEDSRGEIIVILEDGTLVWSKDLEVLKSE